MTVQESGGGAAAYPHSSRTLWAATAMIAFVVLIPMLIGVTSSRIISDLGISVGGIGIGMAAFWAAAALSAWFIAPFADRLGWRLAGAAGLAATAAVQLALGLLNVAQWSFILLLAIAGMSYGLVMPASNVAVATEVPPWRRGLAIGAKQAAAPLAGMIAGIIVPIVVLMWDWRWAYIAGALLTASAAFAVVMSPSRARPLPGAESRPFRTKPMGRGLVLLSLGGALATVPVSALSTYAVLTLEQTALSLSDAGIVVAIASAAAVTIRLVGGVMIDRTRADGLLQACVFIAIGASGTVVMATGNQVAVIGGVIVAFCAGWAWPGLILVGILRVSAAAAGRSTGKFQVGTAIGATSGPMIYVSSVDLLGTHLAWGVVAVVTIAAVPLILLGRRSLRALDVEQQAVDEIGVRT